MVKSNVISILQLAVLSVFFVFFLFACILLLFLFSIYYSATWRSTVTTNGNWAHSSSKKQWKTNYLYGNNCVCVWLWMQMCKQQRKVVYAYFIGLGSCIHTSSPDKFIYIAFVHALILITEFAYHTILLLPRFAFFFLKTNIRAPHKRTQSMVCVHFEITALWGRWWTNWNWYELQ